MSLLTPAWLWAASLVVPVVALHILRSRRTQVIVASTIEWEAVERPVAAARPWQRLRWSIPLVLQLLAVVLLTLALARPEWRTGRLTAQNLVVIIDTSASMAATDGSPNRLADARDRILEELDGVGASTEVSIISAGSPARVVAAGSTPADARRSLDSLSAGEGGFDAAAAGSLAFGFDRPDESVDFVLVSDGGIEPSGLRQFPAGTRFLGVGDRDRNVGVGAVSVQTRGSGARVLATVQNFGRDRVAAAVRVDVDGRRRADRAVQLDGGASREVAFDVPSGEIVDVDVDVDDHLSLDNRAHAVGPDARDVTVAVVAAEPNPFLAALLATQENVVVSEVAADAPERAEAVAAADVAIFDRVDPPSNLSTPAWVIAAPGGAPGVSVVGTVDGPVPALIRSDAELLAELDLRTMGVGRSQRIDSPGLTTLVGSETTPLVVSGRPGGVPLLYMAMQLAETNFGLMPEFAVFGDRVIAELANLELAAGSLRVGATLDLPEAESTVIRSPSRRSIKVEPGESPPVLDEVGVWTVAVGDAPERPVVVNPDPTESDIAPSSDVAIPGRAERSVDGRSPVGRALAPWLLGVAAAVVVAEWWFSRRRRGVSRRQWKVAEAVRAVIVAALVTALIVPTLTRSIDDPGVVFVVDVSDSMAGGADEAVAFVREALADMPDGAQAGVVVVGASAAVDRRVAEELNWSAPGANVDGSATDLAAGVRLAGAVLPSDVARRVVLVTDGQATGGDEVAEARRLAGAGIALDVVPIERAAGPDVLVRAVDAPATASPGQSIEVDVIVNSSVAQRAVVTLLRNDAAVDETTVELPEGDTTVTFTQPAENSGLVRWAARVSAASNGRTENDLGRASTRVTGATAVLLVDGGSGQAGALDAALRSTGATVTTVAADDPIGLEELAAIDVVVLADVSANALSETSQVALDNAVRTLGKGLVAVGGTSSYGSGSYLGSTLEGLLPVVSEVKDPKRRSSLAQVFAVDVSGSMGACHCAEDGTNKNSRPDGGVEKTKIARDAGLLALEALEPTDELGVLGIGAQARWFADVQPVGDGAAQRRGLGKVDAGDSSTNLEASLSESARQLRESDATVRHIVLLTDGFVDPAQLTRLAEQAALLRSEGVTVSVMGTGEGSAKELEAIAVAGGGRYYRGTNLRELPDLLLEETKVVARNLISEGEFTPTITSNDPVLAGLDSSPPLFGFQVTTARPNSQVHLKVGAEDDPLLVTGRAGLGRTLAWTSDAGARWATGWAGWAGWSQHWTNVVRSVAPTGGGSVRVEHRADGDQIVATFDKGVDAGGLVSASVVDAEGRERTVPMRRVDDSVFEAPIELGVAGTYALSAVARTGAEVEAGVSGTATVGFSREYRDEPADVDGLEALSSEAGGRGSIRPQDVFDRRGLEPGRGHFDLGRWLTLLALLLVPVAVAVSRLRRSVGPDAVVKSRPGILASAGEMVSARRRRHADRAADPPANGHSGRHEARSAERLAERSDGGAASPRTVEQSVRSSGPNPPRPAGSDARAAGRATSTEPARSRPVRSGPGRPGSGKPSVPPAADGADGGSLNAALAAKRRRRGGDDDGSGGESA